MARSSRRYAGRSVVAAGKIAIRGSWRLVLLQCKRSTKTFGVRFAVVALAAAPLVACSSVPSAPDDSKYIEELSAERARKDQAFRAEPDSPIPAEKRDAILPLPYYPIDPNYAVPAVLRLAAERPVFEMLTSSGQPRRMQLVGVLEFTLHGETRSLVAFVED